MQPEVIWMSFYASKSMPKSGKKYGLPDTYPIVVKLIETNIDCGGHNMIINFNEIAERKITGMNGGKGEMSAKMFMGDNEKIIPCRIHAGGSIGMHNHLTSDDINYILSGTGKAICDGKEEILMSGVCHICQIGSEHSIINTGDEDLVMLTIVVGR